MRNKWTREHIIRHLVEREAKGQPLTIGGDGVDNLMYQAAGRIFGSWRNAIVAAGIAPERALLRDRWPQAKIFLIIRNLAQRRRPLNATQMESRYGDMMAVARRVYGSWTKAVMAAGVDPTRLQRVVPWNRERVIEAILTRALRNESLVARHIAPPSLVQAGRRFFGDWTAAVTAAGLDPKLTVLSPESLERSARTKVSVARKKAAHRPRRLWTKELIISRIHARLRKQQPLDTTSVRREDIPLYRAARRHYQSWGNALRTAGLDPVTHRRSPFGLTPLNNMAVREQTSRQSQTNEVARLENPA